MIVRLLIDGYNLLYATGAIAAGRGQGDLARARERLLRQLSSGLSVEERRATQIVFDASRSINPANAQPTVNGITVTFSNGYAEADDLLEELIRQHPNPRRLVVISSDLRIQRCAKSRTA